MRRFLSITCCTVLLAACGGSAPPPTEAPAPMKPGEVVFNAQCALCHGRKGDLGLSGAKDLTRSMLTREDMIAIVTHGKGGMMAYAKVLSAAEIEQVVDYARTLHATE